MFNSRSQFALAAGLLLAAGLIFFQPAMGQLPNQGSQQKQQIEVKDKEIEKFVKIREELQPLQAESREKMDSALEEVGLTQKSYRQIVQQMRNAESQEDANVSEEKLKKAREASQKMQKIQRSMQKKSREIIQNGGMSPQRFQKISRASRTDSKLRKRIQEKQKNNN